MTTPEYSMVTCPACRLRAPADHLPAICPGCGAAGMTASRVDTDSAANGAAQERQPTRPAVVEVAGVLDNVRSALNVGAMFRTADAAGIGHLHLVGLTARPPHATIAKTALGAEATVAWTGHPNGPDAVDALLAAGWQLWALEAGAGAVPLPTAVADLGSDRADPGGRPRIAFVVGHEVVGTDPEILARATRRVAIPMRGAKHSLNVATAFGIAAYALTGLDR